MQDPETVEGDTVRFRLAVSVDRDGFLRRTCPACGRDFKTELDPADLQWALSAECRRVGLDVGDADHDTTDASLRCPFCAHVAESPEMHTEETSDYLRRLILREFVLPKMNAEMSALEDVFSSTRGGAGFLSISMKFTHERDVLPARPIHGPEPADMKIVSFLCCGKRLKVPEAWTELDACAYCRATVVIV